MFASYMVKYTVPRAGAGVSPASLLAWATPSMGQPKKKNKKLLVYIKKKKII